MAESAINEFINFGIPEDDFDDILSRDETSIFSSSSVYVNEPYYKFPKRLKVLAFEASTGDGNTVLHRIVLANTHPSTCERENYLKAILRSLTGDIPVNCLNKKGDTALHLAVKKRNNYILEKMFCYVKNLDINAKTRTGETTMNLAIQLGYRDVINILLLNNFNINEDGRTRMKPIHCAVYAQNLDILQVLLDNKCDINSRTKDFNDTPLHFAVRGESLDIIKTLISRGAKINARNKYSETPLHLATSLQKSEDFLKVLCENGAGINTITYDFVTVLHLAAMKGNHNLLEFFILRGANVDAQDIHGETPLHLATYKHIVTGNHLKAIEILVLHGADVNSQNINGETPLRLWNSSTVNQLQTLLPNKRRKLE